jgi:hypothetical protein
MTRISVSQTTTDMQGRIQDFKLGGAHLKKLRRAEGGAKIGPMISGRVMDLEIWPNI